MLAARAGHCFLSESWGGIEIEGKLLFKGKNFPNIFNGTCIS
ncbi:hypothetical protein bcere0022_43340 [Bacillus cereus Rock3-44]|nr:hypothetical protein bcere0022_43340 [Bacillus cereus Rock3-44]